MRRKAPPPRKRKRTSERLPGELELDHLGRPNLNRSHLFEKSPARPHPMLQLTMFTADGDLVGAFLAERYGTEYLEVWNAKVPPSWMDPELFIRLCLKDAECVRLRDRLIAKPSEQRMKALQNRLQTVFEEKYLAYALKQFAKVTPLLARWLTASEIYRATDPELKRRGKKKS